MNAVGEFLSKVDDFVWGVPLIVLILVTGIILTIRLRGVKMLLLALMQGP